MLESLSTNVFIDSEIGKWRKEDNQYKILVVGKWQVGDLPSKWGDFNPGGRHVKLNANENVRYIQDKN